MFHSLSLLIIENKSINEIVWMCVCVCVSFLLSRVSSCGRADNITRQLHTVHSKFFDIHDMIHGMSIYWSVKYGTETTQSCVWCNVGIDKLKISKKIYVWTWPQINHWFSVLIRKSFYTLDIIEFSIPPTRSNHFEANRLKKKITTHGKDS